MYMCVFICTHTHTQTHTQNFVQLSGLYIYLVTKCKYASLI